MTNPMTTKRMDEIRGAAETLQWSRDEEAGTMMLELLDEVGRLYAQLAALRDAAGEMLAWAGNHMYVRERDFHRNLVKAIADATLAAAEYTPAQQPVHQRRDGMDEDEHILQFFAYAHLPSHLAMVSKPFCDLAHAIVLGDNAAEAGTVTTGHGPLPHNPERAVALRKLLEAKDAAVRALVAKPEKGAALDKAERDRDEARIQLAALRTAAAAASAAITHETVTREGDPADLITREGIARLSAAQAAIEAALVNVEKAGAQ